MEPTRAALIVAIANYRDPKLQRLRAPAADAQALAGVLSDPSIGGFGVELAVDEDEAKLRRHLARFFSDRRPDDLLLVHFSCHGIKDASGELYMAAADTETELLSATGIPSRWFNEQIDRCRSKRIVVLLDCCFSGSFPFGVRTRAGEQVDVQQHLLGRGRVVITASNAMEYSFEGDDLSGHGRPSVFTEAVVEGLNTGEADRDGDRLVSVDELYEYVYDHVRQRTPHQNPTKLSSLEGPLYVARSSYERPVMPAPLPQELLDLARHPYADARLGAIEGLTSLLRSENRGIALSARRELERMTDDDSRKVAERATAALVDHPGSTTPVEHVLGPDPSGEGVPDAGGVTMRQRATEPPESSPIPAAAGVATERRRTGEPAIARAPLGEQTRVRLAGVAGATGAVLVLASLAAAASQQTSPGYVVGVVLMSCGVVVLLGFALRSDRAGLLLTATGLALALLGVTFPMNWVQGGPDPHHFPSSLGFWGGACGAALAAIGAARASWLADADTQISTPDGLRVTRSRAARICLVLPGPLIVILSIFLWREWSRVNSKTTWENWSHFSHGGYRFPAAMIVLSVFVLASAIAGIRSERRRLLVIAAAAACLMLGEAVPLFFAGEFAPWGAGRWLRIAGAVIALAAVAWAAANTADSTASVRIGSGVAAE